MFQTENIQTKSFLSSNFSRKHNVSICAVSWRMKLFPETQTHNLSAMKLFHATQTHNLTAITNYYYNLHIGGYWQK